MSREFVPYDIALAMKELGFDEPCIFYYAPDAITISKPTTGVCSSDRYGIIASPLYQQLFRWFREEYGIVHTIYKVKDDYVFGFDVIGSFHNNSTYEEAQDACLRKLIEIVNQNKDE